MYLIYVKVFLYFLTSVISFLRNQLITYAMYFLALILKNCIPQWQKESHWGTIEMMIGQGIS